MSACQGAHRFNVNLYFLVFEILIFSLCGWCALHAWRFGLHRVWLLIAGVLFGVLLELATIRQLNAYRYGQFLVMVADVPLAIGVAWGVIIYSVRLFSDASSLPEWARPLLDAFLALNIDLAADALAIRLGMWDWGRGLEMQYFGVPYANFWAWFWVVASFSTGSRLLAHRADWLGRWLSPLLALSLGLIGVLSTNALIVFVVPDGLRTPVIASTLGLALAIILTLRPRFFICPVDPLVFWTPLVFHVYFLVAGLISGVILDPPFLLGMSLAMLALAFYLHRPTLRAWLRKLPAPFIPRL